MPMLRESVTLCNLSLTSGRANATGADGNPFLTNQRGVGFPRIVSEAVDIGAVEFSAVPNIHK